MTALLQTENLSRFYGNRCAIQGLDFSLEKGEVLGFLGPNGAGKTTTLNMLSGNLPPTSGRIRINGIDLASRPRQAKNFLGYLPDIPPLYPSCTVDEFLLFCTKIHRIPANQRPQALAGTKSRCGLEKVGDRLIANLSKGYRQRVGIAQAILHSPPLIILDEPSVALDPNQIREIRDLIRELGKDHAVIFSSHILSEVQSVCTRALIIDRGRPVLDTDMRGLEQSLESSSLLVKTRLAMDPSVLQQINGVESVDLLRDNSYRVFFKKNMNPSEAVSETVVNGGWGLLEILTERRTIEELFGQLTEQSSAPPEPGTSP